MTWHDISGQAAKPACRPWCTREETRNSEEEKREEEKREEEKREEEKREEEKREEEKREEEKREEEKREEEKREEEKSEEEKEEKRGEMMEEGVEMEERRILGTEIDMTPVWECKRMFRDKRFSEYRRCIGRSKEAARHDFLGESLFFSSH